MSNGCPVIRAAVEIEGITLAVLRESLCIAFYLRRSHVEISQQVMRAIDTYRHAIGARTLNWYKDDEGDWRKLAGDGWSFIRKEILELPAAAVELRESDESVTGFSVSYRGFDLGHPVQSQMWPQSTAVLAFWLPTEFLEERGPGYVRELALELGAELPFNSGHAGLAFHWSVWVSSITPVLRERMARHPGMDFEDFGHFSGHLGTRVRSPHWLTFLGQPVLGELGGVAGLQSRLHSPGTTVQEMDGDRAVITLGPVPEAGDLEQGITLPHYRELAQVLEPWLFLHEHPVGWFTKEEIRCWERRFLDPRPGTP